MLQVDFHSHSLSSRCGMHTCMEMLERAKALGMAGLAITDHGPALGGHIAGPFFDRLDDPLPGIRLIKGVECNLLEEPGRIDCPCQWLPYMDIVLLGIHPNTPEGLGTTAYTDMLILAMDKNPYVDVIVHANATTYDLDLEAVVQSAMRNNMVIELNNSKCCPSRSPANSTRNLMDICKRLSCPIVVSSDAHAVNEIGQDSMVQSLLQEVSFPQELIRNIDADRAFAFLEQRRDRKQNCKPSDLL